MDPVLISELCLHRVTAKAITAVDAAGDETLGVARTLRCYYERKTRSGPMGIGMGAAGGSESTAIDVLITPDAVTPDDRIWRNGEDTTDASLGRKPKDVRVFYEPGLVDGSGNPVVDHYEVEL